MNLKRETAKALVGLIDIPSVYGYANDDLRSEVVKALYAGALPVIVTQHVCNEVASKIERCYPIGYSYEDRDLESLERAQAFFDALNEIVSGRFVLIDTGDLIMMTCGEEGRGYHREGKQIHDCETFDPRYWLYLVPRHEWELQRDYILRLDTEWRTEKSKCSFHPLVTVE